MSIRLPSVSVSRRSRRAGTWAGVCAGLAILFLGAWVWICAGPSLGCTLAFRVSPSVPGLPTCPVHLLSWGEVSTYDILSPGGRDATRRVRAFCEGRPFLCHGPSYPREPLLPGTLG